MERAEATFGRIDVLVNNAGFGSAAAAELMPIEAMRELFETNTFGTIAVTQAVLPQFRQRKTGVVVNVTSSVTLKPLPLIAAYRASKAAVNAFTESMALELEPFGVRVRLVLPGRSPDTRFAENAREHMYGLDHEAYADLVKNVFARFQDTSVPVTYATDVAEAVWRAATDPSCPTRIPAGADANAKARLRLAAAPRHGGEGGQTTHHLDGHEHPGGRHLVEEAEDRHGTHERTRGVGEMAVRAGDDPNADQGGQPDVHHEEPASGLRAPQRVVQRRPQAPEALPLVGGLRRGRHDAPSSPGRSPLEHV